jgi:hypothetical protein
MPMTAQDLIQTGRLTLKNPRGGARMVMNWPLSMGELWLVLGLMAVLSSLLAEFLVAQASEGIDPLTAAMMASPLGYAAFQFAGLAVLTALIHAIGRRFGGTGSFAQALAVMGWLQAILIVLQVAQILAFILVPPLAAIISLISLVLFLWLLTSFTAELHGFVSLGKTFLGIIASFLGMSFILSLFLVLVLGVRV